MDKKSLFLAYVAWWFGGWCGLHHFYLGRDNHALLTVSIWPMFMITSPLWFFSWVRDFFRLPSYVDQYNETEAYLVNKASRKESGPSFSPSRFLAQLLFAGYFTYVGANLKLQSYVGIDLPAIDVALGIAGCTLGVWMVACCGDEQAPWHYITAAACFGHFVEHALEGPFGAGFAAVCAAQWFRSYRTTLPASRSRGFFGSVSVNSVKVGVLVFVIAFSVITSTSVEVNGEQVELREVIKNALRSEGFKDFMSILNNFFAKWQSEGFEKAFENFADEFKERFDVDGEDHAYKVLGLKQGSTLQQVKKAHRKLALQNHPDKGGNEDKFREIQEAYETLAKVLKSKEKFKQKGAAAAA